MSATLDWRGHAWISLLLRWYLGGVFLIACWHKLLDPGAFALDIAMYQFLPLELVNIQAIWMPWLELFAGLMLIIGLRTRAAAALVSVMMLMFMVALAWALSAGLEMGCGCFASDGGDDPISWHTLVRDGIWLSMGLYILICDRNPLGLDRLLTRWSDDAPPA